MRNNVFNSEKVKISLLLSVTAIIIAFFIKTDKKYTVIDVKKTSPVEQNNVHSVYADIYNNIENLTANFSEDTTNETTLIFTRYKNSALGLYFDYPQEFLALEDDKSSDISLLVEIYNPNTDASIMKIYKDLFWYDIPRQNKDVFNEIAILYPNLHFVKEQTINSNDVYTSLSASTGEHVMVIVSNGSLTNHSAVYYNLKNADEDMIWAVIESIAFVEDTDLLPKEDFKKSVDDEL